jgi:predicted HTH transcriptional regulator
MNSDNPEYLSSLLLELCKSPKETEWLEFKVDNATPDEIGENISALANSAALEGKANGYLVWGVEDISHQILGTNFFPSRAKKGNEELENWLIRLLNTRLYFRIFEFEHEGKPISIIEIPRASHSPVQFQGQEYIRIGSCKKKLKEFPEIERRLWRIFDITPFEEHVVMEKATDSDITKLLDYASYFELLKLPLPGGSKQILLQLAADHLIESRQDGLWNILNLGAILFARNLNDFRYLRRKAIRVVLYKGDNRTETLRELDGHKGYASGYQGLIEYLKTILPQNEVIRESLRETVSMYPELAVRELVANAIIHQDYSLTGTSPLIEIFNDRLEITNPGEPLMAADRFVDTPPRSRNEALASLMRRVGICEERGSGIKKVVFQTEFYQLPAPLFEVSGQHTRVILFAHKPFAKMDKENRIRACYLHSCLQYVNRSAMTNMTLRKRFGIDEKNSAQVSRIINDTIKKGFIRPYDPESESRKMSRYIPYWA